MEHQQLYEEDIIFFHKFSTENIRKLSNRNSSTAWLLSYDSQTKQLSRDPRFTHGNQVFAAQCWQESSIKCKDYPQSFSRTFKSNPSVPEQFHVPHFFSKYTKYNIPQHKNDFYHGEKFWYHTESIQAVSLFPKFSQSLIFLGIIGINCIHFLFGNNSNFPQRTFCS